LRPSAGREPLAQDPGSATQHDREVNVHQVTVVTLQESDLGGDVQLLSQGGHIDLVALPRLVSPHDEASGTRHLIQVDDDIAAAGQDPAHGRLPGTRSAGHGHQHRGARGRTSYMSYDRGMLIRDLPRGAMDERAGCGSPTRLASPPIRGSGSST